MMNGSGKIVKKVLDAVIAVVIVYLSLMIWQLLVMKIMGMPSEVLRITIEYVIFIFLWLIVVGFCLIKKNRPILKAIGHRVSGNNWKNLVIGLGIGFLMNVSCVLVALLQIEGTWVSTAVILLVIVCIWLWGKKYGNKPYDVWSPTGEEY